MGLGPGDPPISRNPGLLNMFIPVRRPLRRPCTLDPWGCLLGPAAAGFGFVAALLWRVEGPQQGAAESMALVAALMGRGRVG